MLDVSITVDYKKCLGFLNDMAERQIPFALANAINDTALWVQRSERRHIRSVFTIRRPEWVDRSVKITHFAKKAQPWATIGIHPPGAGGESRADILTKFESDTVKLPRRGTIAIPVSRVGLRRNTRGIIAAKDRPRNVLARGKGAFIIRKKMGAVGEGLILQRVGLGKGRSSVVTLYYLASSARIKPELRFVQIAVDATSAFPQHMVRRLDEAVRTAK